MVEQLWNRLCPYGRQSCCARYTHGDGERRSERKKKCKKKPGKRVWPVVSIADCRLPKCYPGADVTIARPCFPSNYSTASSLDMSASEFSVRSGTVDDCPAILDFVSAIAIHVPCVLQTNTALLLDQTIGRVRKGTRCRRGHHRDRKLAREAEILFTQC